MSVSDPLIRELKACTSKFLQHSSNDIYFALVTDADESLVPFCTCLEKIFFYGITSTPNSFGFIRHNDPWTWCERSVKSLYEEHTFASALEGVRAHKNVFTNLGKFRLMVRYCLAKKCLHVPVEAIINSEESTKLYDCNSILGDEILSAIFLSVLYQCSKIQFKLDVTNTAFLDLSWLLPEMVKVELVPTQNLGLSVSFSGEKAIVIKLKSNSVTAECPKISVGDVLDRLNDICICSATKGRLSTLLKCQKGLPINLVIIKAINSQSGESYGPIFRLYKDVNLDPDIVRLQAIEQEENEVLETQTVQVQSTPKKKASSGFKVIYVGDVDIGKSGDMKMIDKAFNILMSTKPSYHLSKAHRIKKDVLFEVGEMGVKVIDCLTQEIELKHPFMEISACGSLMMMPHFFAYIAGDFQNANVHFKCYIFKADNDEIAYTILQGIGQGFQRTHYAV